MIESFWGINVSGITYRVAEKERVRILNALVEARENKIRDNTHYAHMFEVQDIFGSRVFIDLKGITSIYQSTPEMREREQRHTDYLNQPNGFE